MQQQATPTSAGTATAVSPAALQAEAIRQACAAVHHHIGNVPLRVTEGSWYGPKIHHTPFIHKPPPSCVFCTHMHTGAWQPLDAWRKEEVTRAAGAVLGSVIRRSFQWRCHN